MDIATLIGLLGASGLIVWAMGSAGSLSAFVDVPSVIIVIGGTVSVSYTHLTLPTILRV